MVDEQLLAQRNNKAAEEPSQGQVGNESEQKMSAAEQKEQAYNEAVNTDRKQALKKQEDNKRGATKKASPAKANILRKGTSRILKAAWQYLVASWFITLIYINIHVFLNLTLGSKYFCNLGEEWGDSM